MNTITRNLKAAILFCLFSFVLVQGAKSQPFNANLATRLQHTLDSLQALFPTTKGMSIGVYYPGQGSWRGASGISEAGFPIHTNMEFGLASNTKLFTAVAIMKLVESNIVHLEDPLSLWLPAYTNVDPTITIRQLLNHRSGVGDVFTQAQLPVIEANPLKIYTIPEVMAFVGPKTFNPGAAYGYSNTNYILAGMVAESATGMHISSLIRDNILTPLQLDSTFFDVKETVLGSIAHPWRNGVDFSGSSRNAINSFGGAAGAMYSTSSEMVQWYNALFNGNVLTPASLAQLTNFIPTGNYGFGLQRYTLFGRTFWGHGGVLPDYRSQVFYDPILKATVAGLSNSTPSAIDGVTALMMKVLVDNMPAAAGIVTGTASVCQGQNSVTYTVPAISKATSYTWTLPLGATGSSSTNSITINFAAGALSGNITVVGTNAYGNGPLATFAVTVKPLPLTTISPAGPSTICGGTLQLTASPVGTYAWSTGSTSTSVQVKSTGSYSVSVTVNGCLKSASTSVTVNPKPILSSIAPNPAAVGANVLISGSNLDNVSSVKFNGVSASFVPSSATQLYATVPVGGASGLVEVTNNLGCIGSFSFQVNSVCATPVITPVTGTYPNSVTVTISCATAGAAIYYTTSGNTPVVGTSYTKLYAGSFQQIQSGTIRAIGVAAGFFNSPTAVSYITITNAGIVAIPVISPGTGTYSGPQNVTLSTTTAGATIYYTTNGNTPVVNVANSYTKLYSGAFQVASTTNVKAMAVKVGLTNSLVASAYLSISNPSPTVSTPVISPATGSYVGVQTVSISCATPSSTIYYTTSGNTPVIGTSYTKVYTGSFLVTSSVTIRALATATGFVNSAVAVSYLTISLSREGSANIAQTGVKAGFHQNLSAWPNPTTDYVNLMISEPIENAQIEVFSLMGKSVIKFDVSSLTNERFSIKDLPTGIYSVRITAKDFTKEIRVQRQ